MKSHRITKMWGKHMKWPNAVGNIVLKRLAWYKVATSIQFVKSKSTVKHNKMRHTCISFPGVFQRMGTDKVKNIKRWDYKMKYQPTKY